MESQSVEAMGAAFALVMVVIQLGSLLLLAIGCYGMFNKAGQPGWHAFIPFYNMIVYLRIAGKPGWWLILMFIPIAQLVISILTNIDMAKKFGRGGGTTVGLVLLSPIFCPILGFGNAKYEG